MHQGSGRRLCARGGSGRLRSEQGVAAGAAGGNAEVSAGESPRAGVVHAELPDSVRLRARSRGLAAALAALGTAKRGAENQGNHVADRLGVYYNGATHTLTGRK